MVTREERRRDKPNSESPDRLLFLSPATERSQRHDPRYKRDGDKYFHPERDEKEEIGIREREGHLSPCSDALSQLASQSGERPPQHDHSDRPMTEEWIHTERDEKEEIGIREREGHLSPCSDDLPQLPSQSGERPPQHDHWNRPLTEEYLPTERDEKEEIGIREREGHLSPCPDDLPQLPSQSGERPAQHDHCNRPMTEECLHPERDERKRLGSGKGKGISHIVLMLQHSSLLNQERGQLSMTTETGP
jgi:hypothetical protein